MPRPKDLSEEDIAKLVEKYRDPKRPGLINYMNIGNDLQALGDVMEAEDAASVPTAVDIQETFLPLHVSHLIEPLNLTNLLNDSHQS